MKLRYSKSNYAQIKILSMKKRISLISICFLCFGCQAMHTINNDYMKADEWNKDTMPDAMETLKKDYLGATETKEDRKRTEEIQFIAKQQIMGTDYANAYEISAPQIDRNPGMPNAFSYYFVNFPLLSSDPALAQTTYLVVIKRFNNQVMYSGVFTPPQGDSFYRYNEILRQIEGK